jgi:Phage integrase central domain/Arm DNA-binding domain
MGLGSYPSVTLAGVRERARELRVLVDQGIDPIEDRRTKRAERAAAMATQMSFAQCVAAYLDAHGDSWKSAKHRQQWANTLDTYANPIIGKLSVAAIDTGLVLQVLEPIWKTKTETANRVRGRLENILAWATVRGYRQGVLGLALRRSDVAFAACDGGSSGLPV